MLERLAWTQSGRTRFAQPHEVGTTDLIGRPITLDHTLAAAMRERAMAEAVNALARRGVPHACQITGRRTDAVLITRASADPMVAPTVVADVGEIVDATLAIAVEAFLQLLGPRT